MKRGTYILLIVTAVLFFLLLQDLRQQPQGALDASRFIYGIEADTITAITILKNGEEYMSAAKVSGADWALNAPIQAPASGFAFAPGLGFIGSGIYQTTFSKEGTENFSPALFGLENPPLTVIFKTGRKTHTFDLSAVKDERLYVRRLDQPDTVYATRPHFYNFFNKDLTEYLPRTIFSFNDVNVARIEMKGGTEDLIIAKPFQDIWMLEQPFVWPGAPDAISAHLKYIKNLRVQDFILDSIGKTDLAEYGLDKPALSLQVNLHHGRDRRMDIGRKDRDRGIYFCKDSQSEFVYTVTAEHIDNLFNQELKIFRNRDLAVLEKARIARIVVDNLLADWRINLERESLEAEWKCTWPEDESVGTARVNDFITTFMDTKVINFVMEGKDKIPVFDLDKPDTIFTFYRKGPGGKDEQMYRLYLKNKGEDLVYGYIDGTASVLRIPNMLFRRLNQGIAAFKSLYILQGAEDDFSSLAVAGDNRVRFECKFAGGRWEVVEPTDKEINMSQLRDTLNILANLKAERIASLKVSNYAIYGFDRPLATITFVARGRKHTMRIGKNVTGQTESFMKLEGSDIVYTLSKDKVNALTKDTGRYIKLQTH